MVCVRLQAVTHTALVKTDSLTTSPHGRPGDTHAALDMAATRALLESLAMCARRHRFRSRARSHATSHEPSDPMLVSIKRILLRVLWRVDKIGDPKKRHPVHKGVLVLYIVYIRAFDTPRTARISPGTSRRPRTSSRCFRYSARSRADQQDGSAGNLVV